MGSNEMSEILKKLVATLEEKNKYEMVSNAAIPKFNYKTSFYDWAKHFAAIAQGEMQLKEPEMVKLAVRKLDGFVGKVAHLYSTEHATDWVKFVAAVDQHLTVPNRPNTNSVNLTQMDVQNHDFDIYAFTKHAAIIEDLPQATGKELITSLLSGLKPEYYEYLMPMVKNGEITTFKEFVSEGSKRPSSETVGIMT
jgi:desulfoferrodoxin (superoxide reductase-like protein)